MAQAAKSRSTTKSHPQFLALSSVDLSAASNLDLVWLMDLAGSLSDLVDSYINQPRCEGSEALSQIDEAVGWFHTQVGEELDRRHPSAEFEAEPMATAKILYAIRCGEGLPELSALVARLALPLKN